MEEDKIFFIHKSETGLSPTQYYYLVQAEDEDSALKKVGLQSDDEELLVVEELPKDALSPARLKAGSLLLEMDYN